MVLRSFLFYFALVLVIRLMGKRQVGQMEPSEFVVTMLLANLAAIPLEDRGIPVTDGLIPMGLILLAERLVSYGCLKHIGFRRILCGKPVILMENGRPIPENLRKTRINLDELTAHLRELGILELTRVQFAILETNGSITAFQYPQFQNVTLADAGLKAEAQELPYTVVSDGVVLEENLKALGKTHAWLHSALQGCPLPEIMLLTATPSGKTQLWRW